MRTEHTEVGHDVSQLCCGDVTAPVLIKHLERIHDLLFRVRIAHLVLHHLHELGEVDRAVVFCVDLVDQVMQLRLRRVLAQRAHHRGELLRGNRAFAI